MMKSVGKLFGMKRKCAPPTTKKKKTVTRVSEIDKLLDDSDEGSFDEFTSSDASDTEYRDSDSGSGTGSGSRSSDSSYRPGREQGGRGRGRGRGGDTRTGKGTGSGTGSDSSSSSSEEKARTGSGGARRKRSVQAQRKSSSSSSSSEVGTGGSSDSSEVGTEPRRKALQRKRLRLADSEDEAVKEKRREAEIKEAAEKRRQRKRKLMELARRRRSGAPRRRRTTAGSEEEEEEEKKVKDVRDEEEGKGSREKSSSEEECDAVLDSSEEEKLDDSSSLKDFIVEDEEKKEGEEEKVDGETKEKDFLSHLPRQFITGSQLTHFQVVVKALLINALDTTFLKSLYVLEEARRLVVGSSSLKPADLAGRPGRKAEEPAPDQDGKPKAVEGRRRAKSNSCNGREEDGVRTKRYAQEMKHSLQHFDERLVLPRLENLKQRSRWKERYKERVECYPKVKMVLVKVHTKGCEACELHRTGRFLVRLSGQLYHTLTLQEDQFMPDDSQSFVVGSVCASRTEVYHALKHYKFHLYQRCRSALNTHRETGNKKPKKRSGGGGEEQDEDEDEDEEPVKETVNKVFTKLQEGGWISEQYNDFQEQLNAADFFQEEKLD